jgi:hypothetical protein
MNRNLSRVLLVFAYFVTAYLAHGNDLAASKDGAYVITNDGSIYLRRTERDSNSPQEWIQLKLLPDGVKAKSLTL